MASHLYGFVGVKPRSFIAYKMRLCTGFRPSCTSGKARPTITDMAYCTAERIITQSPWQQHNFEVHLHDKSRPRTKSQHSATYPDEAWLSRQSEILSSLRKTVGKSENAPPSMIALLQTSVLYQ